MREFTLTKDRPPLRRLELSYDAASVRERFMKLTTPFASDVLHEMGWKSQVLDSGIYPLVDDMIVAGPAFTWSRYRGPIERERDVGHIDCIPSITPGCVVISDDSGDRTSAHMGDIISMLYRAKGCVGAVLDGNVRDTKSVIAMNFPMFCRGKTPVAGHERSVVIDYQVPIFMHGVDGMLRVNPGDYVFGDRDGVVIIPGHIVLDVLARMEAMAQIEVEMRAAVAGGMDPVDAFHKYHRA